MPYQHSSGAYEHTGAYAVDPVAAQIIDNLERGNLDPYTTPTDYTITTDSTFVFEGSNALRNPTTTIDKIYSTSDLDNYAQKNTRFTKRLYVESGGIAQALFGGPDGNNCYILTVSDAADAILIQRLDGGSFNTVARTDIPITTDEHLLATGDWASDDTLRLTIATESGDIFGVVEGADSTYNATGWGWRGRQHAADIAKVTDTAVGHTTGVAEDFEDDDLSDYQGSLSNFEIVSSPTHGGSSFACQHQSGAFSAIYNYQSLDAGPFRPGDTAEIYVYGDSSFTSSPNCEFVFGFQDTANFYVAEIIPGAATGGGSDNTRLQRFSEVSGNGLLAGEDNTAYNTDSWIKMVLDWAENKTATLTTFDDNGNQLSPGVSATLDTFQGGAVGYRGDVGSTYDDLSFA